MAKKRNDYFESFITQAELACEAAEFLRSALGDFKPENLQAQRIALHEIESRADGVKHDIMKKLAKEFVTPIEREDIIQLINELDEVIDLIEDVLIRIYMYNIQTIRPAAGNFADVICRSCDNLKHAFSEFHNFQKSRSLQQAVIDANTLEEEGDAIYIDAMRDLFVHEKDPVAVLAWSETFDRLEECCDACEHVADILESVIMKNS